MILDLLLVWADESSGTGREIAGIFLELPDPKLFEDYYKAILKPISLQEIEVGRKPQGLM